jgi:hypothetical protein
MKINIIKTLISLSCLFSIAATFALFNQSTPVKAQSLTPNFQITNTLTPQKYRQGNRSAYINICLSPNRQLYPLDIQSLPNTFGSNFETTPTQSIHLDPGNYTLFVTMGNALGCPGYQSNTNFDRIIGSPVNFGVVDGQLTKIDISGTLNVTTIGATPADGITQVSQVPIVNDTTITLQGSYSYFDALCVDNIIVKALPNTNQKTFSVTPGSHTIGLTDQGRTFDPGTGNTTIDVGAACTYYNGSLTSNFLINTNTTINYLSDFSSNAVFEYTGGSVVNSTPNIVFSTPNPTPNTNQNTSTSPSIKLLRTGGSGKYLSVK